MKRRQVKPLTDLAKGSSRSTFLTTASVTNTNGSISHLAYLDKDRFPDVSPAEGAMGMRDVVRRRTPRVEKILKGSLASGMEKTGKEGEEFKPIRIDVNQVDPYLAALSRTDFNHVAFATELILHYFQPFVTLFVFDPRVRVLCRNRHFIYGGNIPLTAFQIGIMICLAVVNVIAVVDNRSFSWYQLAIFNISTLLRYIVIAIKYAYMSPIEYAETFTNAEANERRHLLTGWNTPEESLRDMQLLLSSVRQQCCLLSAHFDIGELDAPSHPVNAEHRGVTAFATMQNDARERFGGYKTEEFVVPQVGSIVVPKGDGIEVGKTSNGLGKIVKTDDAMNTQKPPIFPGDAQQRLPPLFSAQTLPEDPSNFSNDAKVEIPVETEHGKDQSRYVALWDVATGIVDESMSLSLNLNWMFLPGLFHTSIPLLSFFLNTNILTRIDWSPHTITMTFFLHLFVALFGMSVMAKHFGFLMVGISDFRRREYFQRRLSAVMNDGYVRAGGEVVRIPMDRAQNIVAWWYLRACLQDWGLNYFRRISAYTGFFLVYVGLLVVIVLVQSYVVQGTVENSIYAYVILHSFLLSGLIGGMIIFGNKYNESRKRAGLFLAQRKVEVEAEIAHISRHQRHNPSALRRQAVLYETCSALNAVGLAVENDNRLNVIKILGFETGDQLMQGVVTLAGIGVWPLLRKFIM